MNDIQDSGLVLHNYFRSSTSVRVRAALHLKGVAYEYRAYHLRKGEQRSEAYLAVNRFGIVPALELPDGRVLNQSLAIVEWLDEAYPAPPLLPADPVARARVRGMALALACEVHPLNNLKVLGVLRERFGADDAAVTDWFRHWVAETFAPLEAELADSAGAYCFGDEPGLADLCLFAQCVNNRRFQVDMAPYPVLDRIYKTCLANPAFEAALPENAPDAE
ncbi:MAG: maleylacetoacetate isomerase [Sneathiellaceae bacterium]